MHEIRQPAQALILVALAACSGAGTNANAKTAEPLVIPPMPHTATREVAPPPPAPPAPHKPTREECDVIMRRIIDLTIDPSSMSPAQRDELVKTFTSNPESTKQMCGSFTVDDESMRCIADAQKLEELQKCLIAMRSANSDDDDDR